MSGIRLKNLAPTSLLGRAFHYGTEVLCPPGDPQHICAFQALASNTADAAFTLNSGFVARGQVLPWPQQIHIVLENNRTSQTGKPGAVQAGSNLSGARGFFVTIVGYLNGKRQTERFEVSVNAASTNPLLTPAGTQLSHVRSSRFYDRIESISHDGKFGTWGTSVALQVGVGTGISLLGEAPPQASRVLAPLRPNLPSKVRALLFPDSGDGNIQGTGLNDFAFNNATGYMAIPGRARDFDRSLGALAVTTSTTARSIALTAHGLRRGDVVRVRPLDNGLPTGLALNTNYYVVPIDADSFRLAADSTALDFTTQAGADTLTRSTGHSIANGTPVMVQQSVVSGVGTTIPAPLTSTAVYFVITATGTTLQLETTLGSGSPVNITGTDTTVSVTPLVALGAGGNFASTETIEVLRPRATWERARLVYEDGENVERI